MARREAGTGSTAPTEAERVTEALDVNAADLLGYFYRRLEVPEDAADLLAETAATIWRRAEALPRPAEEARMWLFGVARNVLANHRRTVRRRSALEEKLRADLAASPVDPEEVVDIDLHHALSALDPLDQEIIRLTYWEGFSLKETARLLERPEGTVRSRHHRARERMRRTLEQSSATQTR